MNMAEAPADYPLSGLKVLDFSRVLAGPFAGRLLADLGADVVKVEPPEGDVTRNWGRVKGGVPGFFHQQNAGKRNICIDLRAPGARELVLDLVRQADVLIENYRPDVMGRLGLGYDVLSEANPRLIMLSISGFGAGGPESRRPAYAPIVHAEMGLIARQARRNDVRRTDLPLSVADTNASLHGLIGPLPAVILRERTGRGQHIDIAMVDATLVTDDQFHYEAEDSEDTMDLPPDIWETKIALRRAAVGDLMMGLADWEKVTAAMAAMNIAWGEVRDGARLREQPTLAHRGSIVDLDDREGGTRPIPQSPYRFSAAKSGVRGVAPHRGEHNAEVLAEWLGLDGAKAAALRKAGVLSADTDRVP